MKTTNLIYVFSALILSIGLFSGNPAQAETDAELVARVNDILPKHNFAIQQAKDELDRLSREYHYAEDMTPRNKLAEVLPPLQEKMQKAKKKIFAAEMAKLDAMHVGQDAALAGRVREAQKKLLELSDDIKEAQHKLEKLGENYYRDLDIMSRSELGEVEDAYRKNKKTWTARLEKAKAAKAAAFGPEADELLRATYAWDARLISLRDNTKFDPALFKGQLEAGEKFLKSEKAAGPKIAGKAKGKAAKLGVLSLGVGAAVAIEAATGGSDAKADEFKAPEVQQNDPSTEKRSDVDIGVLGE